MTTAQATYEEYKQAMDNYTWHGTEKYYKFSALPILLTDGTHWFCRTYKALWLMKLIGMMALVHQDQRFLVADVQVENDVVQVTLQDGDYHKIDSKDIRDVDGLPDGKYEIWMSYNYSDLVLYLKTEH